MSFENGECPVCKTTASAKCRNCGLESSPFEAAIRLGGGSLLIAAEATRRIASADPAVVAALEEVRWISRMRAWAMASIQNVEMAIRKLRPNPKEASDDERRWLSESAKNPLVIAKMADLTVELVTKIADKIDGASASVNAKRVRRPVIGEPDNSPETQAHSLRSGTEVPEGRDERLAFFKTPEGAAWLAEHFDEIGHAFATSAKTPEANVAKVPDASGAPASKFSPPYHLNV